MAGYIGPYIYFTHPEMFLITVKHWNIHTVGVVLYDLAATVLVLYMLSVGFTGWLRGHLNKVYRTVLIAVAFAAATLNVVIVGLGLVLLLAGYYFTGRGKTESA